MKKRDQANHKGRYTGRLAIGLALIMTWSGAAKAKCPLPQDKTKALQAAIDAFTKNGMNPSNGSTSAPTTPLPGILLGIHEVGEEGCTFVSGASQINPKTGKPTVTLQLTDEIRIGSITKTFVATLILKLVSNQQLSLDDTLNKYRPDLNVPNDDKITIKQLLNMTSGVPNYLTDTHFFANYYANPGQPYTPEELVKVALKQSSDPPGSKWEYSNTNYILLGLIAEKVVGDKLSTQMQDLISKDLDLKNTTFPGNTTSFPGDHSNGYSSKLTGSDFDPTTILDETASNPTAAWAAGAMLSTLGDQMTWIEDLILDSATTPARLEGNQGDLDGLPICYGLGLMDLTWQGAHYIGHGGEIIGYTGIIFFRPDKGTYFSIFINRFVISSAVLGTPQILAAVVSILYPQETAAVQGAIKSFRLTVLPEEVLAVKARTLSGLTPCTISLGSAKKAK